MDETYLLLISRLRSEGRLSDYRAGELRTSYAVKRSLFGWAALATAISWLVLMSIIPSWVWSILATVPLAILFMVLMHQTVLLEHRIDRVSERVSDYTDKFLEEFLAPSPELHQLYRAWRSQGPIWRHDEVRLVEVRQYARSANDRGSTGAA